MIVQINYEPSTFYEPACSEEAVMCDCCEQMYAINSEDFITIGTDLDFCDEHCHDKYLRDKDRKIFTK